MKGGTRKPANQPRGISSIRGRPSRGRERRNDWRTPPLKLGSPRAFDLITDPKEEYPQTALRHTWNAKPIMKIVADFEKSLKKYPPTAPVRPIRTGCHR